MVDFLIAHGVEAIFVSGSCGVLDNIDAGKVLLPYKALRDEGPSYKYIKPSRFIEINNQALLQMEEVINLRVSLITTSSAGGYNYTM